MRIIACAAIILLHSLFASFVYYEDAMTAGQLKGEILTEHMLMWAVPLFLMITGALLLDTDRKVTFEKLFKKYIKRIAVALISFTLIFQILDYIAGDTENIIGGWISNLISGHSWAHVWYLYLMLGLYLMLPVYKKVIDGSSKKLQQYIILLLLLFTSVLPMIKNAGYAIGFDIPTVAVYPVYLFLGYYLYNNKMKRSTAVMLMTGSSIVIIITALLQNNADESLAMKLAGFSKYYSIFVIGQTAGIFSLFNTIRLKASNLINSIDKCTFGIYLIHMIGIRLVFKWMGINPYSYGPVFFICFVVVLFISCYAITALIRKIPRLNLL